MRRSFLVAGLAGSLSVVAAFAAPTAPPAPSTPVRPVKETVHGVEITDNFRWLEGDNSVKDQWGKVTPEVGKWTDEQNAYTRTVLDNLPGRAGVEKRLRELMEIGSVSAPSMSGNRYFYRKREGNENQDKIYVREGHKGAPRLLLDPMKIDPSGLTTISWVVPSEDGTLMAYGSYRAGDEIAVAEAINVTTGQKIPLHVGNKVSQFSWLPDNSGYVYRNLADVKNPYSGQVMYSVRFDESGKAPGKQDAVLLRAFTPEENKKLATTYGPGGSLSKDGRWLVLSYSTDTRNNDLWVADFAAYRKSGKLEKVNIVVDKPAASSADIVGDTLILTTNLDAPNGMVYSVDLKNPAKENWKVLVPHRADVVVQGTSIAKGIIAVNVMKNACTQIELLDFAGTSKGTLKLPQTIGAAGLSTEDDRTEAFLSFSSYNYPTTIFRVDLSKPDAEPELWERPAAPVDVASIEVKQDWYTSKDGTKISMFVIHKKGLTLNGDNPTILYGYGGFNVPMTPGFSSHLFQWFESGGVYVVANLRGGGEYGQAWHESGRREKKQNVFDDFAAAAKHLIAQKYTKPQRLAVAGGSNGGLLTGVFATQNPDLCAAAIVAVPLLDMIRYQNFLMARYWIPEYGSSEDATQFKTLMAYSPYHNIKAGTKYPAVMLTAGENDSRVHALHARKMAAALREATASDQSQKPILLWVDREAGHGQGKSLDQRIRDAADQRMFLMWQLGMLKGDGK